MPSRQGDREIVGITSHTELIIMISFGMVRNVLNLFSTTWNRSVQEIWNIQGPEPSFTAKYHFDYWLKNVLSLVVLFRKWTTHLHLLFYIVMLYPLLTGERYRLMLPWLYLQMVKNIVTDVICTAVGALLCWIRNSSGLLTLEFLLVQIISMMPSIYLWRRLRSYYFILYYAELDGEYWFPPVKENKNLTLAQRRRATKSLDGTASSEYRSRTSSCLTYDQIFGPANWEDGSDDKLSKSLTTLLTVESQESDDAEEGDPALEDIDDQNLSPAEKTLKILGLTREEVDAAAMQLSKRTSPTDLAGNAINPISDPPRHADLKFSFFSVIGENLRSRAVGIQVCLPNVSECNTSNTVSKLSKKEKGSEDSKKCECREETKCSKEEDADSVEEQNGDLLGESEHHEIQNGNEKRDKDKIANADAKKNDLRPGSDSKTLSTTSPFYKTDLYPSSCLRAVGERDGIAWENLKEINFVSVINKALCNGIEPFKLQTGNKNFGKCFRSTFENVFEDRREESNRLIDRNIKEIIPEREDGTKFIDKSEESADLNPIQFSGPTSASFGIDSDILAVNTSYVFDKIPISETQSFYSSSAPTKQLSEPVDYTEFDSYFKSSFQRHSNMFDDTRAQLEPLDSLQCKVHSSPYQVVHEVDEDSQSHKMDRNFVEEKTDGSSYSLGFYRSRSSIRKYQRDNYDGWDYSQGNFSGNDIDVFQDINENSNSEELGNEQIISGLTRASQTSSMMFGSRLKTETISNSEAITQTEEKSNSTTTFIVRDDDKSSSSKSECQKGSKDRRSLASSSKYKNRETKEMQALRAYNEKTLFKYKREMDKFRDSVGSQSSAGKNGNNFNQAFYVPSLPELEKPDKELILNIENAYGRFTRSRPVDPVNSEALHGNFGAKEFFDIYNGNVRAKKDSRKIKVSEKTGMRKQYSKYSKPSGGENESDVTKSESCKRIDGLQKGRDLGRTVAKENIRAQNVEVYFLERQIDEKPTTSKNVPITTIKSFSRNTNREILSRIENSEYKRSRKHKVPKNFKETVRNIDWRFQKPICDQRVEKTADNMSRTIVRTDLISERQDIGPKTTENILQSIFANSENSERGFHLGESGNEFYPIFNTVSIAIEEIVRAAALRGYTDEFISQPATEIEIPEIEDGNLYGSTNLPSERTRRSSSGFFRCCILPEDSRAAKKLCKNEESVSITTFTAPDTQEKKVEAVRRETNLLDQDETISIEDEESSSLLSKLISSIDPGSAEINLPVIGAEDVPEQPEDTSGDFPNPGIRDLEDYSSFLFKDSSTRRKSSILSNRSQIGIKSKRISSERVRLALHDIIYQSPRQKMKDMNQSQFLFDVHSHRGILNRLNSGGNELQSIVFEFFDQFPNCEGLPKNLRCSDFVAGMQIRTNLYAIETKLGEIINAREYGGVSEETAASNSGNSTIEQNDRSDQGTSGLTNFENFSANTSTGRQDFWQKEDREKKRENNSGRKVVVEIDSNSKSGTSSLEKIDEHRQGLLSNISEPETVSLTHSELLNRENFRRQVISSAFLKAVNQDTRSSDSIQETEENMKVEEESLVSNYEELNESTSRNLMKVDLEVEMPELWITNDDEEITTSDTVLRDIETAERAIKSMKTIFEQFFAGSQNREKSGEREKALETKSEILSLINLRFPVNGELQKLQKLVQTIVNYVTIAGSSSAQPIKSSNKGIESGSSNDLEEVVATLQKNGVKSDTNDFEALEDPVPKTKTSLKNSESPVRVKREVERFSSWDMVIPLSTKRQIAKNNRKNKAKRVMAVREPPRRVLKVVKLIEAKNSDFFSARSVPQRGRGLSSGYLMDSDSDGNFTVSRPNTPVSIESESSRSLSCDNEQSQVFSNPLRASEIFPMSETSRSRTTNQPIETCWSSSSANKIKHEFPSMEDDGDQSIENELCNEELHVLGDESLSIDGDRLCMSSVDAAEIEDKLKDVVQQILNHQFSRINPSTNRIRIGSKDASFYSISEPTGIDSSTDWQSSKCIPEDDVAEQEAMKENSRKRIQELMIKDKDTSYEQLNVHYTASNSTSRNSDAVSFEVPSRKSRVNVKNVAIETEYNIEVFKDLLKLFEKNHSIRNEEMLSERTQDENFAPDSLHGINLKRISNSSKLDSPLVATDKTSRVEIKIEKFEPPELATTSYDSFSSLSFKNTIANSEPSCQAISISNHTFFEEFPEQIDSGFQLSPKNREGAGPVSSESITSGSKKGACEKRSGNFEKSDHTVAAAPGSSKSDSKSKQEAIPKKSGIPKAVKSRKECD